MKQRKGRAEAISSTVGAWGQVPGGTELQGLDGEAFRCSLVLVEGALEQGRTVERLLRLAQVEYRPACGTSCCLHPVLML